MSLCLSVYVSIHLCFISLCVYLAMSLIVFVIYVFYSSVYVSIHLWFISIFVYLTICLSVDMFKFLMSLSLSRFFLSIFLCPYNSFFFMIIYQGVYLVYISIFLSLHVYLSIKFNIAYSVYLPDNIDPWIFCLNKDKRICKYFASFHGQFVLRSFRFYANPLA